MTIEINKLSSGITGASFPAVDIPPMSAGAVPPTAPAPAGHLPEGWHDTEKYGSVFVSPGGIAWAVQLVGSKFENIAVDVSVRDFIGQSVIERRKEAVRKSVRRARIGVSRTTPPILTPQATASTAHEGIGGSL